MIQNVNIAELKSRLSFYLKQVQAGQEIIIRDRQRAIGRITPISPDTEPDENLLALHAQGKIKLGHGEITAEFWQLPKPRIKGKTLKEIMDEEREG